MADTFAQMVAVDFIGNQKNMVSLADFNDFSDFLFFPYPSHGIGRRTENQHFIMGIGAFFFQIVKVDGIVAVSVVDEMIEHRFPLPFRFHGRHEMTVNRGHENDAFAFFGEHFHTVFQRAEGAQRNHGFF